MSTVGSTSGNTSYLYQLLQSVKNQAQGTSPTGSAPSTTQSPTDLLTAVLQGTQSAEDGQATRAAGGAHRHHHHGGGGQFFQKIQAAVSDALKAAPTDGSSDPNQVIENAISSVLQSQSNPATAATDNPSTGDIPVAGNDTASAGSSASSKQAFDQLLQSYGVNAQQFRSDFAAALKDVGSGGTFDPSKAFQSFPPGTIVDKTA